MRNHHPNRPAERAAQIAGAGFSIVEVLSPCPVGWGLAPVDAIARLRDVVVPEMPPGIIVDRTEPILPSGARVGVTG